MKRIKRTSRLLWPSDRRRTVNMLEQAMNEAVESVVAKAKPKRARKPKPAPEKEPLSSAEEQEAKAEPEVPVEPEPEVEKVAKKSKPKAKKPKAKKAPPSKAKPKTEKKSKKPAPSKGKAKKTKGKATPAQLKAAASRQERVDWVSVVEKFKKAAQKNAIFEMGTPGSAQVTRCRLLAWEGFKGLNALTRGPKLLITKLSPEEALAAAKKAGKL